MALCKGVIGVAFVCLLMTFCALASNGTADGVLCSGDQAIRTSSYMTYLGCYNFTCFVTESTSTVSNIDQCTIECRLGGHSYAALSDADKCSCGMFICDRNSTVCEAYCGIPCKEGHEFMACGGLGFLQVYKGKPGVKDRQDTQPRIIPVIVGIVLIVAACLTCFIAGMYGRRRKRRHDRHQVENPTLSTEQTSQCPSRQSRDNIYNIVGGSQHHLENTTNGFSVSSLSLSSENNYDHISTSNRINFSGQRHQGCNSLPRCLPSLTAPTRYNPSSMRKVTEGVDYVGDEECSGFCCPKSKYGRKCSCLDRREPGKPRSDRMAPYSKSNGGGQFVPGCDHASRRVALEEDLRKQEGKGANEIRIYAPENMCGGRGRDRAHTESLKGPGRMLSNLCKEREMLVLPCERGAMENQHSRKDSRRTSSTNNGRPPVTPNVEKQEDGGQNDTGAFYHTLESGTLCNPSTSADYFTLEPCDSDSLVFLTRHDSLTHTVYEEKLSTA